MSTPPEHTPASAGSVGTTGHEPTPPGTDGVVTPPDASHDRPFPAAPPPPPETAPTGPPLASRWLRLSARILDSLLAVVAVALLVAALFGVGRVLDSALGYAATADPDDSEPLIVTLALVGFVLVLTMSYLYFARYLYRHGGQTLGKRVCRIRVVGMDGNPVTAGEARRRWLAYEFANVLGNIPGIGALLSVYLLLDILWLLWDKPYRQCLHDKVARTIVVDVPAA